MATTNPSLQVSGYGTTERLPVMDTSNRSSRLGRRIVVFIAFLALVGAIACAIAAPDRMPQPFAVVACMALSHTPLGAARCSCAGVVMNAVAGDSFAERQRMLTAFADACNDQDQISTSHDTNVARLHQALAVALLEPSKFSPERVRELAALGVRPGTGPQAMPYYPAPTLGEAALMNWLFDAVTNQPSTSPELPVLSGADARRHPELAARLQVIGRGRRCVLAWAQARATGTWDRVGSACASVELPASALACLRADTLASGRAFSKRAAAMSFPTAVSQGAVFDCTGDDPCRLPAGIDQVLLPIPTATPSTFLGLAQLATEHNQMARCLDRVSNLPSPLRWLAEFLGPASDDERRAALANLTNEDIVDLSNAITNCSGQAGILPSMTCTIQKGVTISLSVAKQRVVEAACLLASAGSTAAEAAEALPWSEPLPFEPKADEDKDSRLAEMAVRLLERLPVGDNNEVAAGCRLTALVQRMAVLSSHSRLTDLRNAEKLLENFARKPSFSVAARMTRCRLITEVGTPERASEIAMTLLRMGREAEAHRCATTAVVVGLRRGKRVDALLTDEGPLRTGPLRELRALRDTCRQGGTCEPSEAIRAIIDPPAEDEAAPETDETTPDDQEADGNAVVDDDGAKT